MVEVEDLLDRRYEGQYVERLADTEASRTHLTVAQGVVLGCHVDRRARSFNRAEESSAYKARDVYSSGRKFGR